MKEVALRDICYQMLQEKSSEAGMNVQNYMMNLIMDDYKTKEDADGKGNKDIWNHTETRWMEEAQIPYR